MRMSDQELGYFIVENMGLFKELFKKSLKNGVIYKGIFNSEVSKYLKGVYLERIGTDLVLNIKGNRVSVTFGYLNDGTLNTELVTYTRRGELEELDKEEVKS